MCTRDEARVPLRVSWRTAWNKIELQTLDCHLTIPAAETLIVRKADYVQTVPNEAHLPTARPPREELYHHFGRLLVLLSLLLLHFKQAAS